MKHGALKTTGFRPSVPGTDRWRNILVSNGYGTVNINLQKDFAKVIKNICIKKTEENTETNKTSLEAS